MMSAEENAIDEAIGAYADAEGWTGIRMGWIVLVATLDHDGEDEISGICTIYQGGSMPWPMALGIIEAGRLRMHSSFNQGDS